MIKFLTNISGSESFWALFSLVFFFCFFVGVLILVFRKKDQDYKDVNSLPLNDGTKKEEKVNE